MKSTGNSKPYVFVIVVVPFLGTILAIWMLWQRTVHWSDLVLLATMYTLTGFGQTIGYHRMLTHRSFRPHPVVKLILLALGAMSVEGPPIEYAATHIKHHAQSDRDGDPHSPVEGFFHAHLGWLFKDRFADPQVYCRYLFKDSIVVFVNRTFLLWVVLSLGIPFVIGGWPGLLWGGLVRIFLQHHVTFSVNSVCHTFGKRAFETNDRSRNEWMVGLLAFGEGWPSGRAGTTIITRSHARLSTGSIGGSSISPATSSGHSNASVWHTMCIASHQTCSYALPLAKQILF